MRPWRAASTSVSAVYAWAAVLRACVTEAVVAIEPIEPASIISVLYCPRAESMLAICFSQYLISPACCSAPALVYISIALAYAALALTSCACSCLSVCTDGSVVRPWRAASTSVSALNAWAAVSRASVTETVVVAWTPVSTSGPYCSWSVL